MILIMMDFLLTLVIGKVGHTAAQHKDALRGHPWVARVFFPDFKDDTDPPPADAFLTTSYDVTC
jgi:hypothetical protein